MRARRRRRPSAAASASGANVRRATCSRSSRSARPCASNTTPARDRAAIAPRTVPRGRDDAQRGDAESRTRAARPHAPVRARKRIQAPPGRSAIRRRGDLDPVAVSSAWRAAPWPKPPTYPSARPSTPCTVSVPGAISRRILINSSYITTSRARPVPCSKIEVTQGAHVHDQGIWSGVGDGADRAAQHRTPQPDPERRQGRDPLLRHLPFGPALRQERMGGCDADRLSVRAGARDHRPRGRSRRGGVQVQGRRGRGRRLHGRFGQDVPELPGRPRAVLPRLHADLRHAGQARHRAGHLRRLLREHRRRRALRAADSRQARSGRGRAAALRGHHDLFAAEALGASGPGKKVGIVGLGGLGHMGVKFAHALGAHTSSSPRRRARRRPR